MSFSRRIHNNLIHTFEEKETLIEMKTAPKPIEQVCISIMAAQFSNKVAFAAFACELN
jgi:hypothetical protein